MGHLDESYRYSAASEAGWGVEAADLAEALRSALHESYSDASDAEMDDALANVLDSMSAAEAFNFASALNQIGKGASQLVSDPTFVAVARTALPVVAGVAGGAIGGPLGAAVGGQLGSLAANALPVRPAAAPSPPPPSTAAPRAAPAAAAALPAAAPLPAAPAPAGPPAAAPPAASPVAAGSAAAAQGLVLTQQPEVLRSLLATALGQHGRQTVSGIPVAQVLGMLSQVFGQAATDADELMYRDKQPDSMESVLPDSWGDSADALYADLIGADNQEIAEAASWEWRD